jgi:hypothetical protein
VHKLKYKDISKRAIHIQGKGNVPREFPVNSFPHLKNALIRQHQVLLNTNETNWDTLCFLMNKSELKDLPINKHQSYENVGNKLRRALKKLSIEKSIGFHGIRKYFENKIIDEDLMNLVTAAQILGYTPAIQSQHYITRKKLSQLEKQIKTTN